MRAVYFKFVSTIDVLAFFFFLNIRWNNCEVTLGRQNPETFACANTQRIFNVEFALNAWPGEFQL